MVQTESCAAAPQRRPSYRGLVKLRRLLRKTGTLARQPAFVLAWLIPVWAMIGLASAAIRLIPLRKLAPVLGRNLGAIALVPLGDGAQARRAVQIQRTISIAIKYVPFRSDCYPQAIVAQVMCRFFGLPAAAHFGLRLDSQPGRERRLLAHAWVVCGQTAICGEYASFRAFSVVGCFATPAVGALARPRSAATVSTRNAASPHWPSGSC